jgi:glutaredoxin
MTARRWLHVLLLLVAVLAACKRGKVGTVKADNPPDITLQVRDSSEGLLLTWIDDKGEFHVEQRATDVPMMGRDSVRVVDPNTDDGTHADKVYIADLRQAHPDGTYPISVMSRADFEHIAEARREKRGPTLASAVASASTTQATGPVAQGTDGPTHKDVGRSTVIIYGAEWCGACHEAAAYLRGKGIPFVEKDIEKDPQAAREMQAKLRSTGQRGGSIPVIDVRGKVMVGFNPQSLDQALGHST